MKHYNFAQFMASVNIGYSEIEDDMTGIAVNCLKEFGFSQGVINDYISLVEGNHVIAFTFPWGDEWRACNSTIEDMKVKGGWISDETYTTRGAAFAAALRRAEARRRSVLERGQ